MKPIHSLVVLLLLTASAEAQPAKVGSEKTFKAANDLTIKVRVTKPQDLDTDLQILGYFKHKKSGDTVLAVIVDFDKLTGGVIAALRNRGAFVGHELETITFLPPAGAMKPRRILLVGYGDEDKFSVDVMGRVGTVSLREAMRLGAARVAFAPALFDQGYDKLRAVEVAPRIIRSVILAYDTEKRLQKEGLAKPFTIQEWVLEAGPEHFNDVVAGVARGVEEANAAVARRGKAPYASK